MAKPKTENSELARQQKDDFMKIRYRSGVALAAVVAVIGLTLVGVGQRAGLAQSETFSDWVSMDGYPSMQWRAKEGYVELKNALAEAQTVSITATLVDKNPDGTLAAPHDSDHTFWISNQGTSSLNYVTYQVKRVKFKKMTKK